MLYSNSFLLSMATFMVLFLSCTTLTSSLVHGAEYKFAQVFKGPSCSSGITVIKEFTSVIDCHSLNHECSNKTHSLLSTNSSCIDHVPLSPQVGEYMEIRHSDSKCSNKTHPSSVRIYALDICIPSDDGSSYMYKGCKSKVIYSDLNCQHELETRPTRRIECLIGETFLCNSTVPEQSIQPIPRNSSQPSSSGNPTHISGGSTEFILRNCVGIVVAVLIMTNFLKI
nr:unnamed protein product [Naegleria fowleri]